MGFLDRLRSYYRGSKGRGQREFYDLESSLPYFDSVNRILGFGKRRVLLELLEPARFPGDPVLEVGCGVGTFARELARRGERVVGIDISPRKVAKGRALTPGDRWPSVELHEGDFETLGSGGTLDGLLERASRPPLWRVIASDVVEHLPSPPEATARRLEGLLAPGGQLLVTVPSRLCLGDPGHIWRLLPDEWARVFESQGFRVARRRMSRVWWYRLPTPLPLAMALDLRKRAS
ncbi:MAG: methyltransferase domain-containing protein [Planctomycetes bacterium]|nr:methyltransferase domain-containing protein [Planctomycetota bacterium]